MRRSLLRKLMLCGEFLLSFLFLVLGKISIIGESSLGDSSYKVNKLDILFNNEIENELGMKIDFSVYKSRILMIIGAIVIGIVLIYSIVSLILELMHKNNILDRIEKFVPFIALVGLIVWAITQFIPYEYMLVGKMSESIHTMDGCWVMSLIFVISTIVTNYIFGE